MIVAMDRARGIGVDGRLPWRLSADLRHFKRVTMGHTLIQGRRTWESIGRPLPGRRMVVLTRQVNYVVPQDVTVCSSLEKALAFALHCGDDEAFIGGGSTVFAEALPLTDRIYLTRVDTTVEADTYFPELDESAWVTQTLETHLPDEHNQYAFQIDLLTRSPGGSA